MGLTAAERQRRSRAHKAGDHSLCDPNRCPETAAAAVTGDVTAAVTRDSGAPRWFRAGGRRLWDEMAGDKMAGAQRVLLEQACRIVDRLDRLDAILNGRDRAWLTLEMDDASGEITVVVDKVLGESRQQATALKQLFAELRQALSGGEQSEQGGDILDELAAARKKRLADAAGR